MEIPGEEMGEFKEYSKEELQEINLEEVLSELTERNARLRHEYETLADTAKLDQDPAQGSAAAAVNGRESIQDPISVLEASKLRQHTTRMEARISILMDHNKQLEARLNRLKRLLHQSPEDTESCNSKF